MMQATIYSIDPCPYCVKAKATLRERGVSFVEKLVGVDLTAERFKSEVFTFTEIIPETLPQIFLNSEYIGGCDDLDAYYAKENLKDIDLSGFEI